MSRLFSKFAAEKVPQAVETIFSTFPFRSKNINILHFLSICHIADIAHLAKYRRPIFGGHYTVAPFGPLHAELAATIKKDPLWLAIAGLNNGQNWKIEETEIAHIEDCYHLETYRGYVSQTDLDELSAATRLFYKTEPKNRFGLFARRAFMVAQNDRMAYADFLTDDKDPQLLDANVSIDSVVKLVRSPESMLA